VSAIQQWKSARQPAAPEPLPLSPEPLPLSAEELLLSPEALPLSPDVEAVDEALSVAVEPESPLAGCVVP
jgi:hypothetical protein